MLTTTRLTNLTQNPQTPVSNLLTLNHPSVWLSVAVLLLNDHILKAYTPSWLTGKLSDFAGMFFFPILLGVLWTALGRPLRLPAPALRAAAFGLTAIWFILAKTQPVVSHWSEAFLSAILSRRTQIVCDPSDLIALIMFIPAWKLCTRHTKQPLGKLPRSTYLILCLASLAALATTRIPPVSVRHLIVFDGEIYADTSGATFVLHTRPGRVWALTQDLPEAVRRQLGQFPHLPVTVCLPDNPLTCYRTAQESIERTQDGGQTWLVSWRIPWGRRALMERGPVMGSAKTIDMGPYDLTLLNRDGRTLLVAAMGHEGLLVSEDGRAWERDGIPGAEPTPYQTGSPVMALWLLRYDLLVGGLAVLIIFCFLFPVVNKVVMLVALPLAWMLLASCLILWAGGVIPTYPMALMSAIVLDGLIIFGAVRYSKWLAEHNTIIYG